MGKLHELIIGRLRDLGQEVMTLHYEIEKWRETPLTPHERTVLGVKLNGALTEQRGWIDSLGELLERDEGKEAGR